MTAQGTARWLPRFGHMQMQAEIPKGLIWYGDDQPGITRRRAGRGFTYTATDGTRIDRGTVRKRIEALAVPPAHEKVWISPRTNGHLMATGYDARTRKQYRYHPDYMSFRAQTKFDDLAGFGEALPRIRRRVHAALTLDELDEGFAIAATLRLMDRASLRVGTPDYAADNKTYGATTLRCRHVRPERNRIRLDYRAKGGQRVRKQFSDRTLNRALDQMGNLPGGTLLQYENERGEIRQLGPDQVNAWLREATGREGLTAKTFRTCNGSVSALDTVLRAREPVTIKEMAAVTAETLHNTPTIARNSYIHPRVIELAGEAVHLDTPERPAGLRAAERVLLDLLS